MPGEKTEANVHAAFFNRGLDLGRGNFLHGQVDPGMAGGEHSEERRHQGDVQDWNHADMERAPELARLARQFLEEIVKVPQNGAGVFLENLSSRSEEDAFPASLKQGDAKTGLEIAHLL